MLDNGRDVSDN